MEGQVRVGNIGCGRAWNGRHKRGTQQHLAMVVFIAVEKRWRDVLRLATPGPVIVTIAIGSSWYLACLLGRRYGFLDRQIGSENFGRFFGSLGAMRSRRGLQKQSGPEAMVPGCETPKSCRSGGTKPYGGCVKLPRDAAG